MVGRQRLLLIFYRRCVPALLWVVGLGWSQGCGAGASPKRLAVVAEPRAAALGVGDVFEVKVYGEDQLSQTYRVSLEGTIDFPFVGRVRVVGLDAPQVADIIGGRLREVGYMREPQVSVFVKEAVSQKVNVVGAVNSPGSFSYSSGMTVVQAVSVAGGFTPLANRNATVVSRRVGSGVQRFKVAVEEISRGERSDFRLQAGDIVYIPERVF